MSIGAEVKALLDDTGRFEAVFRLGQRMDTAKMPYATFIDPLDEAPALRGDARTLGARRLLQVDLWQDAEDVDDTLADDVAALLDGQKVEGGFRLRVDSVADLPDEDPVVHHALTVSVARVR